MALSKGKIRTSLNYDILDLLMEGFQLISFDWRYLFVNQAVCKHGKLKREELLGFTMMEKYPGIENTEMFKVLKKCMINRVSDTMENKFSYPDGSTGWFELRIVPVPEGIFILSMDISERKNYELELVALKDQLEEKVLERTKELQEANDEITGLYREMHHRIKNNLQIVSSLLSLHAMSTKNERVALELLENRNRVNAIAQVHKNLYSKERIKSLNLKTFIRELLDNQIQIITHKDFKLNVALECIEEEKKADFLVPLGLIINELIANSVKHGFKARTEGDISLKLYNQSEMIVLDYADNGSGIKRTKNSNGFGSVLIQTLVDQLRGKFKKHSSNHGVHYEISVMA